MRIGLAPLALVRLAGCGGSSDATEPPSPPQLPQNFLCDGRWVVRDLDVDVRFSAARPDRRERARRAHTDAPRPVAAGTR